MKAPSLLAALFAGPLGAIAQTTLQIAVCGDLPSSITTDTTLQFTAQEVTINDTHDPGVTLLIICRSLRVVRTYSYYCSQSYVHRSGKGGEEHAM